MDDAAAAPSAEAQGNAGGSGAIGSSAQGSPETAESESRGAHTATTPTAPMAPPASAADGVASRVACTDTFGNGLGGSHGRLDGYLVAVVPPGGRACSADHQHVHLQVKTKGDVYDVAVNIDGLEAEVDAPLPGEPWSEGWHLNATLDYVKDLGLHSEAFQLTGLAEVRARIETAIANANHVAIFATPYNHGGAHLVHRQDGRRDGAIVLDPLSSKPHVLAFRFEKHSF